MDADAFNPKSGQSVIEFCIGLVALLTVVSGIFQLGMLGLARTSARVEATETAAILSMNSVPDDVVMIYPYIGEVQEGNDGRAYSADDEKTVTGVNEAYQQLLEDNQSGVLRAYAPGNDLATIASAEDMQAAFGMVRATASETNIPILPIVRRLFFDQGTVDIEAEVWSVRTGGLY